MEGMAEPIELTICARTDDHECPSFTAKSPATDAERSKAIWFAPSSVKSPKYITFSDSNTIRKTNGIMAWINRGSLGNKVSDTGILKKIWEQFN